MKAPNLNIDERLLAGKPSLRSRGLLLSALLEPFKLRGENLLVQLEEESRREELLLLPTLDWLALGSAGGAEGAGAAPPRRALVLAADRPACEALATTARELGAALGIGVLVVTPAEEHEGIGAAAAPVLEGGVGAALVIGEPDSLLAAAEAGLVRPADFGFLGAVGLERLAETSALPCGRLAARLLPAAERRSLLFAAKLGSAVKSLAWELAANPAELRLDAEKAAGTSVATRNLEIAEEGKLPRLLALIRGESAGPVAVFRNLKPQAEELALRLRANGIAADYILGSLDPGKKLALLESARRGELRVLVLTDEGAEGLAPGSFARLVNLDLPLEAEPYLARLELLDREAEGAGVLNLVCERYLPGLGAIASFLGSPFPLEKPEPELLEEKDESAALVFKRSEGRRGGRGGRAGRLVDPSAAGGSAEGGDSRGGGAKGGGQAGGASRGGAGGRADGAAEGRRSSGSEGGSRRRRGGDERRQSGEGRRDRGEGGPDRRPEIRKSVAEATGGDLAPTRGGEGGAKAQGGRGGRGKAVESQGGRKGGRGADNRGTEGGRGRGDAGRQGRNPQAKAGNEGGTAKSPGPRPQRGPAQDGGRKGGDAPRQSDRRQPQRPAAQPARAPQAAASPKPRGGILGALAKLFGRKKDA